MNNPSVTKIIHLICKPAMLSLQIITYLFVGMANAAFICPRIRSIYHHDCSVRIDYAINTQFTARYMVQSLQARSKMTVFRGSLRDILNDGGPITTSESVNSQLDTVEQRQKLTNQLKNFSTQEIKRELEQTYKISTAALRGKDQLITALVMARMTGSLSVPPTEGGVDPNFRDQYKDPLRGESNNANGSSWVNNANYQKDMELMSVGEIKRELQLYGVSGDAYTDKPALLSVLIRERRLRNIPTPSKRPKIEVNVVPTATSRLNRNPSPGMSDEEGNESIRSPSRMAELTKVTILTKNQKEAKKSQSNPLSKDNDGHQGDSLIRESSENNVFSQQYDDFPSEQEEIYSTPMETPFYVDEFIPPEEDATHKNGNEGTKLRDLQIAFEFDRVQEGLPTPDEIRHELASKFNIDTKYFMGVNEMVYALAVARVDAAIEREKLRRDGKDDLCEVSDELGGKPISKNRNANFDGVTSSNFNGQSIPPECLDEVDGALPSREELISMEFQRLQPLDEYELSWELEAQHGIPAKHFLGKQELAYALAVERVDTAQKEADAAIHDNELQSDVDSNQFAWMSEEDMMRMMEEEMMKEAMPQQTINISTDNKCRSTRHNGKADTQPVSTQKQTSSNKGSQSTSLKDIIQNNSEKRSRSRQSTNGSGSFQYQGETLRERERRESKSKHNTSAEPQMGTVVGGESWDKTVSKQKPPKAPPLSDILKETSRTRASPQQKSRVRATAPPPRPPQRQRPPRSASRASSPFDVSFGVGAWKTKGGIGNSAPNAYQNYGVPNDYGMPPRSPFEVPPFPDPDLYASYQPEPPPPPFDSYSSDRIYSDSTSFEPGKFTPPRKHNAEGMPPPSRRKPNSRGFNIRDTEGPRPFIGVQTVMDQFMPPSPPLQVEPPPSDDNPPPKRPFEPAPFSRPQPHTVYNDRPPREPRGSKWKTAPPPPPKSKWNNSSSQTKRGGPSPFDRMKDIFTSGKDTDKDKFEDQVKFKYDRVEVMNDKWSPFDGTGRRESGKSNAGDVKVVDAQLDDENAYQYKGYANAWKGGPKSEHNQQVGGTVGSKSRPADAMKKAYELLANTDIQAVATKARSNPKVREAVQACLGDPKSFGGYLEDSDVGPILQELKDLIVGL